MPGTIPPQGQDFLSPCVKLHEVSVVVSPACQGLSVHDSAILGVLYSVVSDKLKEEFESRLLTTAFSSLETPMAENYPARLS